MAKKKQIAKKKQQNFALKPAGPFSGQPQQHDFTPMFEINNPTIDYEELMQRARKLKRHLIG